MSFSAKFATTPTDPSIQQYPTQDDVSNQISNLWLIVSGILVFMMQPGFAMVEVGQVRIKSGPNLLLKNVLDASVGSIVWWAVGYGIAFGNGNCFMGQDGFLLINHPSSENSADFWAKWFFQWAFAATAATIVSGALAERCQFRAYIIYTIFISGFIYPVIAHWVWSSEGWLATSREKQVFKSTNGLLDFAGSGVVHMVGGGASLIGAAVLGPRLGRFNNAGESVFIPGQSTALATLGTFILWVSWYGFNCGSVLNAYGHMEVSARVSVTTTLSTAAGCVSTLLFNSLWGYPLHITPALNGLLGGAVAITAGCAFVEPYAALIIGIVSGFVYSGSSRLLRTLTIDDPVDASPIHFFCGIWGLLSVGFFATEDNLRSTYDIDPPDCGVIYSGKGDQLAIQVVGALAIAGWTLTLSTILFGTLKFFKWFRIPEEDEIMGLNLSMHNDYDIELNTNHLYQNQGGQLLTDGDCKKNNNSTFNKSSSKKGLSEQQLYQLYQQSQQDQGGQLFIDGDKKNTNKKQQQQQCSKKMLQEQQLYQLCQYKGDQGEQLLAQGDGKKNNINNKKSSKKTLQQNQVQNQAQFQQQTDQFLKFAEQQKMQKLKVQQQNKAKPTQGTSSHFNLALMQSTSRGDGN